MRSPFPHVPGVVAKRGDDFGKSCRRLADGFPILFARAVDDQSDDSFAARGIDQFSLASAEAVVLEMIVRVVELGLHADRPTAGARGAAWSSANSRIKVQTLESAFRRFGVRCC